MSRLEQVLTAAQMRAAEDALIERGVSVAELMDRAGRGAADWVWRVAGRRPVTVLCGPGNNGGDGYVIADTLRRRGLDMAVVAPLPPSTDACRSARAAWGGVVTTGAGAAGGSVLVDCLFGSGLSRPLSPELAQLLADLAGRHDFVVAVDVPSGIATDSGALLGPVSPCDLTIALGAWKPAHFLMPASGVMGTLRLVDIGIGRVPGAASVFSLPRFTPPARDTHKYRRGLVGVVAGAMPGAALLAAQGAMRGGAGYVKLLAAHSHPAAPPSLVIENARLADSLAGRRWSALIVGPGLGRDEAARERLSCVLERGLPTLVDADALHMLDDDMLEGVDPSRILVTPHEGELAALGQAFGMASDSKMTLASRLAQTTGLTVLAKGPDTILAAPDGRLAFFPPASSWLSVAGTGDVLAGIAGSRVAVHGDLFRAAGEAVWLHSEAAALAGAAFTADDLLHVTSEAYTKFL